MRRDVRRKKDIDSTIILSIVCTILVIAAIIIYAIKNYSNKENENNSNLQEELSILENAGIADTSTEYGKTVDEIKNETLTEGNIDNNQNEDVVDTNKKQEETINTNTTNKENKNVEINKESEEKDENETIENKDIVFNKPLSGEILREFATENLVYSETLQEWITHNGVDIKSEKATVVTAVADGKVYAIKNDPRYGLTVIIEHDNGFKSVYSNLLTAEFVVEGEEVTSGQTIGTVGATSAFEICDESHLHFELLKDNQYVDPKIYINFE